MCGVAPENPAEHPHCAPKSLRVVIMEPSNVTLYAQPKANAALSLCEQLVGQSVESDDDSETYPSEATETNQPERNVAFSRFGKPIFCASD